MGLETFNSSNLSEEHSSHLNNSIILYYLMFTKAPFASESQTTSGAERSPNMETVALKCHCLILSPPYNNKSTRENTNSWRHWWKLSTGLECAAAACVDTHTLTGSVTFTALWGNIQAGHIYKTLHILGHFHVELKESNDQSWKNKHFVNGSHRLRDAPSVTSLHPAEHAVHYKVLKHLDNQYVVQQNTPRATSDLQGRRITTTTLQTYI